MTSARKVPIAKGSLEACQKVISRREQKALDAESPQETFSIMGLSDVPDLAELEFHNGDKTIAVINVMSDMPDILGKVMVYVDWSDPLQVYVTDDLWKLRTRGTTEEPDEVPPKFVRYVDEVMEKLQEFYEARPISEGLWWADENYYPIRPLIVGEDPDIKPEEWVTVVKGTTGEVVSEAKKKKPAQLRVHPDSYDVVRVAALDAAIDEDNTQLADAPLPRNCYLDIFGFASSNIVGDVFSVNVRDGKYENDVVMSLFVRYDDKMNPTIDYDRYNAKPSARLLRFFKNIDWSAPVQDDVWWADEDYYPIRPLFVGEDVAKKPEPWCTVIKGSTGEVIREAKRAPKRASLSVHRDNWASMMRGAKDRLASIAKNSGALAHKPLSFQVYILPSNVGASYRGEWVKTAELCDHGEAHMDKTATVRIDLQSDPEKPAVRTVKIGSKLTKEQVNDWKKELLDHLDPQPDPSGLWWADENFYPIRPVYEGEATEHKPEPSCTLVNGASGEVVKEMRFYTLKQLREVLDAALDEVKWVNADDLEAGTEVAGWQLHKGMKVSAEYNTYNAGTDVIEIAGFGDDKQVMWDSVQQAMKDTKTKTMKALDAHVTSLTPGATYGHGLRLWGRILGHGGTGAKWGRGYRNSRADIVIYTLEDENYMAKPISLYYLDMGRWVRGGAAERLRFMTLDVKLLRQAMDNDEYRTPDNRLLTKFKIVNADGDLLDFAWWLSHMDTYDGHKMPKIVRHYVDSQTGYGTAMPIESVHDAETCAVSLKNLEGEDERNMLMQSSVPGGFKLEDLGIDIVSAAKAWFKS